MKEFKKEAILLCVLFVVFPAIYCIHYLTSRIDSAIEGELHCSLVEQYSDGNTLIVSLKNEGNVNWSEEESIRCTIFVNGEDTGIRAILLHGQIVEPGDTADFRFDDVASILDETAEIVMLQEAVTYFEERFPIEVLPQEPMIPQTDLHCELVEQHMDGDSLVVTMKNTGGSDWKHKDWIRCTIFIDDKDSDLRAELQPNQTVAVGESVQFRFEDVRSMLNETAEIVMLQETVTYFEERFPVE